MDLGRVWTNGRDMVENRPFHPRRTTMNLRKYLSNVRDYDMDDVLGAVGLQKRSGGDWIFPMLAGLGAGMAIGAGLAFFLTPYKGAEAREKFGKAATDAQKILTDKVNQLSEKVSTLVGEHGNAGGTQAKAAMPAGTNVGGTTPNRSY
jgi:hypothetical protein